MLFNFFRQPTIATMTCNQQPRWSQKFIHQFKSPDTFALQGLQRELYVRDYQDRLITVDKIFQQKEAGIPLLIEALRDPYGAVRVKAEQYLQQFDRPEVHDLMQVLRYRQLKCKLTLSGHSSGITTVNLSPDNHSILSTAGADEMCLWDAQTGAQIKSFAAVDCGISQAIFSADGRYIISNANKGEIWIWEIESGKVVQKLPGHTDRVSALQLAPAGRNLLSGSWDNTIGVWDLSSGKLLERWTGHTDRIYALALSPDGQRVFSGGADGTIRDWQRQGGEALQVYQLGNTIVYALAVHPTEPILFSGDKQVRFSQWNYQTGEHLDTLPAWTYRQISAIVPSANGEVVLHNCGHGISVWHQATNWLVHTMVHHRWAVTALAMSADGQLIVSGSDDQMVKIWGWG
jgi:WD40 repeat protein